MSVVAFRDKKAINESHPLYGVWHYMIKAHTAKSMVCERWLDFWNFVEDVKERPSKEGMRFYFSKRDFAIPYGPDNWRWKSTTRNIETRKKWAEYMRGLRKRNPEAFRDVDLKKCYGITIKQYDEMLKTQNGICAICEGNEKSSATSGKLRPLAIDHCHATGKIRGLLCSRCNRALGFFGDSIPTLKKAISYLGGNIK